MPTLGSLGELTPYEGPIPKGMKHVGWYCPNCDMVRRSADDYHASLSPGCIERVRLEGPIRDTGSSLYSILDGSLWTWANIFEQVPLFAPMNEEEMYDELKQSS